MNLLKYNIYKGYFLILSNVVEIINFIRCFKDFE